MTESMNRILCSLKTISQTSDSFCSLTLPNKAREELDISNQSGIAHLSMLYTKLRYLISLYNTDTAIVRAGVQ